MSKRLIRTFAPSISHLLPKILFQEAHVVLRNGNTIFGYLQSFSGSVVKIKDLRSHQHEIQLGDIEEIVQDHRTVRSISQP